MTESTQSRRISGVYYYTETRPSAGNGGSGSGDGGNDDDDGGNVNQKEKFSTVHSGSGLKKISLANIDFTINNSVINSSQVCFFLISLYLFIYLFIFIFIGSLYILNV